MPVSTLRLTFGTSAGLKTNLKAKFAIYIYLLKKKDQLEKPEDLLKSNDNVVGLYEMLGQLDVYALCYTFTPVCCCIK